MPGPGAGRVLHHDLDPKHFASRGEHEQEHEDEPRVEPFRHAQFVGYILKEMKVKPDGTMEITISVPRSFKDFAIPLLDANMIPLSIDILPWKPFEEAIKLVDNGLV